MKRIGVREFRDHATKYLAGEEVLAVERHGQPIGFYIPTSRRRGEALAESLARLDAVVRDVLRETGMTEDELVTALAAKPPDSELDVPQSDTRAA